MQEDASDDGMSPAMAMPVNHREVLSCHSILGARAAPRGRRRAVRIMVPADRVVCVSVSCVSVALSCPHFGPEDRL
jgi:hypothetical protein